MSIVDGLTAMKGGFGLYDRFTLPNGLRVIAERMPHYRSVSMGLWVRAGSVNEGLAENGYSHFIEHMMFKGTDALSAKELAQEMDALGGRVNASTSKECTCFHARVLDEHLPRALKLLSDILLYSRFDEADIEKEKGVVLEEISMVEDIPEDVVHDLLSQANFGDTPLARTILGPEENIKTLSRDSLLAYHSRFYTPENTVLSLAGNYDLDSLQILVQEYFGAWQGPAAPEQQVIPRAQKQFLTRSKQVEQAHLCLGYDGVRMGADEVYPLTIFNTVFGGGLSSHLFQTIREQLGLAYSVYSYPSCYTGRGVFVVYAGTGQENVQKVIDLVAQQADNLLKNGVAQDEFRQAKEQLAGGYVLGQESTSARMNAIGSNMILGQRVLTEADVLEKIGRTTLEDVNAIMRKVLSSPVSAALIAEDTSADFSAFEARP